MIQNKNKEYDSPFIYPLKEGKELRRDFIVFDTETQKKNVLDDQGNKREIEFLRFGYAERVNNGLVIDQKEFTNRRDFTIWLLNQFAHGKEILYVFAHNTSFDVRVGLDLKYVKQRGFIFIPISASPFIFKIWSSRKESNKIIFLDTYSFFKTSLEEIGDKIGVKKIEIKDFSNVSDEIIRERCLVDVEITRKTVLYIYDHMRGRVSVSLPQLGFRLFKKTLDKPIERHGGLSEKSYYAGRTELIEKGIIQNCVLLDVNSMYPFAMSNPLPYKFMFKKKNVSSKEVFDLINSGYGISAKVTCDIPSNVLISPFPFRRERDNKLIFPLGRFETYLNSPEIMLNPEYISRFQEIEVYQLRSFLRTFVEKYYQLKKDAKNDIDKEFYKLLLNSVYGKFGQKQKITSKCKEKILLPSDDYTGVIKYVDPLKGISKDVKVFLGNCYTQSEGKRIYSPMVSSFICSYARADLYERILKAMNDIIYIDTDGFIVKDRSLSKYRDQIGDGLGQLKIEKRGVYEGFRCKFYSFNDEIRCRGIPRNNIIRFDIKEGKAYSRYRHLTGLNESIRRLNTVDMVVEQLDKKMSLIDDKRIWSENLSKPITLNMI